jgi:hypothetical protein
VSDERFARPPDAETAEPNRSCLVVTRPQRRQAPGQDGGFDSRVQAVVVAFLSDYYQPSRLHER